MAINYYDAGNQDGLFNVLGKIFKTMEVINTFRGTTLPASVTAILTLFDNVTSPSDELRETLTALPRLSESAARSLDSTMSTLAQAAQRYLLQIVKEDATEPAGLSNNLIRCLQYIQEDMETAGHYLDASTVGNFTFTPGGSNTSDIEILETKYDGKGRLCEHALVDGADSYPLIQVASTSSSRTTLRYRGDTAEPILSEDWPGGSGATFTISVQRPEDSLLENADFENWTVTNTPDNWTIHTGVIGTDIIRAPDEVQTVIISGTPTGGTYTLTYTDPWGVDRTTDHLAYNASSNAVQTALRALPTLEAVTVVESGTTPNLTHTITFREVPYNNPAQLTSTSYMTGGSPAIAHATSTAGSNIAFRGRALQIVGNNRNPKLMQQLPSTIKADTVYFCSLRVRRSGTNSGAATKMLLEIVTSAAGSVRNDWSGNANKLEITLSSITNAGYDHEYFSFRITEADIILPLYLRITFDDVINGGVIYGIDDLILFEATRIASGAQYIGAVSGVEDVAETDEWTGNNSNNRGGSLHEWVRRSFPLLQNGLFLPTANNGGSNFPDSVIA